MTNRESKYDVNSAEVQAILFAVIRSGPQSYYRINPDGQHVIVPIRRELMSRLQICSKSASKILKAASIPYAPFIRNQPEEPEKPAPTEAEIQAALAAAAAAAAKEAEKEAKKAEAEERANSKRWQLIETNSGKHGIWNAEEGRVICLYLSKQEAVDELARLRAGSSQAGGYYNSRRSRTLDPQEIHY